MRPGASLVGWVRTADSTPIDGSCIATLELHTPTRYPRSGDRRLTKVGDQAGVSPRGFFQAKGLQPGSYRLEVRQEGFVASSREVLIIENRESAVSDPIVLKRPRTVEIQIIPELDRFGRSWNIVLKNQGTRTRIQGGANEEGLWVTAGVPAGRHSLQITDSKKSRWFTGAVEIAADEPRTKLAFEFPHLLIEGQLTLGGELVAGHIWFGGKSGVTSIYRYALAGESFSTTLPRIGEWKVDVELLEPQKQSMEGLSVEVDLIDQDQNVAEASIDLPATEVTGMVLDAQGMPLAAATVVARSSGTRQTARLKTRADGSFQIVGLPPGKVTFSVAKNEKAGPSLTLTLSEESPITDLLLILSESWEVRGNVVSDFGPVPRARLVLVPSPENGFDHFPERLKATDLTGSFSFEVPASPAGLYVLVISRGYSPQLLALHGSQQGLKVHLDQTGGELLVQLPLALGLGGAVLYSDGHPVSFSLWALLWGHKQDISKDALAYILPMMPPGQYVLCQKENCIEGYLAPHGRVTLDLSRAKDL